MSRLFLVAALAALVVPFVPTADATVCAVDHYAVGAVTIEIHYNRPGPPGPYMCITYAKVCDSATCFEV